MKSSIQTVLLFTGVGLLFLLLGIYTARWLVDDDVPVTPARDDISVPDIRPGFSMPDLSGKLRSISEWNDKVVVLNFWATWCPPCLKEMPTFTELREELAAHPFEVIGVAIDQPDPVQDFIDTMGVEYPILLGEETGIRVMQDYGNRLSTLPYTVVINRQQKIVKVFRKEINRKDILETVGPLLGLESTGIDSAKETGQ